MPGDVHMASVWQNDLPRHRHSDDGCEHTSRATTFPPNIETPRKVLKAARISALTSASCVVRSVIVS
jgi:hypothetical protein